MTKREEIVSVAESKVGLNRNEVGCGGDGDFGSDTEKAVKNYQKDHGLDPDGIAGEKTLTELWNCKSLLRKSKKENK